MSMLSPTTVEKEKVIFSEELSSYSTIPQSTNSKNSTKGDALLFGMFMYFIGLLVIGIVTLVVSVGGGEFGDGLLAACLIPSIFGFLILSSK